MSSGTGMLGRQVRHELVALVRSPVSVLLTLVFPVAFFVLLASLFGNETLDERGGIRMAQFLAPGMATFGVAMATFSFLAVGVAQARVSGALKRQSGTPLPGWVRVGGRLGASTVLGTVATALVLGVGVAGYQLQLYGRSIVTVVVTLLLGSFAFGALGLALGSAFSSAQSTIAAANGFVIPLSFVSDVFMSSSQMPDWLARIASFFPLKHVAALLGAALDPYASGSGLAADHLAVLVAWGVGGALAATWAMRRDPSRGRARVGRRRHRPADAVPRRGPLPSSGVLVAQVRHSLLALLRDPSAVFFAVAFPVLLVAVIPAANGGGDIDVDGRPLDGLIAVTMAVYGSAVTAYLNMPVDMVENRDRRVLDRLAGTPLPNSAMLAGRVTGAVLIGSVTLLISLAVGAALYGSGVPPTWPAAVAVLALGSACLGLLGLAVAGVIRHAQSAVGILLGTLLPLAFVSDIFIYGVTLPGPLNAVSWFLPLRHLTRAMTDITAPDPTLDPTHLLVVAAWTVVAALAVAVVYRALPRRTRSVRVGP